MADKTLNPLITHTATEIMVAEGTVHMIGHSVDLKAETISGLEPSTGYVVLTSSAGKITVLTDAQWARWSNDQGGDEAAHMLLGHVTTDAA